MLYDPPYTLQQIKDHYDDATYKKLASDPIHRWRAETGIELIHHEPSYEELQRIWKNWQLMSDKEKIMSDQKSIELFGVDNETHFYQLQDQYEHDDNKIELEESLELIGRFRHYLKGIS